MIYFDYKCVCKNCGYVFRRGLLPKCCFDPVGEMDLKKCNANEMPYNCTLCATFTDKLKNCKPNHYYIPEGKYCLCSSCKDEILPSLDSDDFLDEDAYYAELEKQYKEKVEDLRKFEFSRDDFESPIGNLPLYDGHKRIKIDNAVKKQKTEQKAAFYNILRSYGLDVVAESNEKKITEIIGITKESLEKTIKTDKLYQEIYQKLCKLAKERESDAAKKYPDKYNKDKYLEKIKSTQCIKDMRKVPSIDCWIPSKNLIIEYDEDQHFTKARKFTLESYPHDLILEFSTRKLMDYSDQKKAIHKPYTTRDEQRAFYDCVRDIEASRNGISIIRVLHGDFDWINSSKEEIKKELIRLRILKISDKY